MVKRRTSRIDTILPLLTRDGKLLRVTVVCLTLTRADQSQVHAIRQTVAQMLTAKAAESDLDTLVREIVSGDLARDIFKAVKTIYPMRRVEITKSRLEQIAAV